MDSDYKNKEADIKKSGDLKAPESNSYADITSIPGLSIRSKNSLLRNGIKNVIQLKAAYESGTLNNIHGIGPSAIIEIERILENAEPVGANGTGEIEEQLSAPGIEPLSDAVEEPAQIPLMFVELDEELFDFNVNLLEFFSIPRKCIYMLRAKGIEKLGDLYKIPKAQLTSIVGEEAIGIFNELENKLQLSTEDLICEVLAVQRNDICYQIALDRADRITIQDLSEKYSIPKTRTSDYDKKFLSFLGSLFGPLINKHTKETGYVTFRELNEIFDNDEYTKLLMYWCDKSGNINQLKFAHIYIPQSISVIKITNGLNEIADSIIGDGADIPSCKEAIDTELKNRGYYYINLDSFVDFLKANGYKMHNDFIARSNVSYGYLCSKLIEKYYPDGFKLYDAESLEQLRIYAKQEYGDIELPSKNSSVSSTVSEYTVFCSKGVVVSPGYVQAEAGLFERIRGYIDSLPYCEIDCSELFKHYKKILAKSSNIDNPIFLYSVLRFHYKGKYDFSKRGFITKNPGQVPPVRGAVNTMPKSTPKPAPVRKVTLEPDYYVGCKVHHNYYGVGVVVKCSYDDFLVDFKKHGVKKVYFEYCVLHNLLWRIK